MSKPRSGVVERLWSEGKTVRSWAAENGFSLRSVRAVISGHNKGNYGKAFLIAKALDRVGQKK
ncbi:helix-turn-helix domain-containing protein [Pseudogemmobacter bohemicus]|uniref:DNA-binding protein n=1 Tax=Pseudogemmobacter bohemicus TaxID=2250708 RepID=UPI000DD3A950